MFKLSKDHKANEEVEQQNAKLKETIKNLEHDLKRLQERYDALVKRDLDESSFAFDFRNPKVNAFSIERILVTDSWSKNVPKTVIGYLLSDSPDQAREWTFNCNNAQHEKLVQQFKESLKIFECMP